MQGILSRIKPSPEDEHKLISATQELLKVVEANTQKVDKRISVKLVGSSSRGTWLRDAKDLDVFVFFPLEYEKSKMEEVVSKIGRSILQKPQTRYAEHPYIKGGFSGYDVELVPCYAVETGSEIKSAVDRTPFHEEFVNKNIADKKDEVRLLKQFLKGIECYGAEAKTEGISGYLAELLVIQYGSFEAVLKQASEWRGSVVIQIETEFSETELKEKFNEHMIFIDPVDSNRNVASALSMDKFNQLIFAAKEYLKNPDERFFFPRQREAKPAEVIAKFEERGTTAVAVVFSKPDVVDDILYPQMKKAQVAIAKLLKSMDFRVLDAAFFLEKQGCIFIELEDVNLPALKLHQGPFVNSEHEERFLEKQSENARKLSEPFIRGDRWYIYLKRKYVEAYRFLEGFLKQGHLEEKGIPRYIAKCLEDESMRVMTDLNGISMEFAPGLLEYFEPSSPWVR